MLRPAHPISPKTLNRRTPDVGKQKKTGLCGDPRGTSSAGGGTQKRPTTGSSSQFVLEQYNEKSCLRDDARASTSSVTSPPLADRESDVLVKKGVCRPTMSLLWSAGTLPPESLLLPGLGANGSRGGHTSFFFFLDLFF